RERNVTGVQTCALPILTANHADLLDRLEAGDAAGYFDHLDPGDLLELESLLDTYFAAQAQVVQMVEDGSADDAVSRFTQELLVEIGRASCRERGDTVEG